MKMKMKLSRPESISEVNSPKTADKSFDYTNVPDQVFDQMLSTAFNGDTNKLSHIWNENEKNEFARRYAS